MRDGRFQDLWLESSMWWRWGTLIGSRRRNDELEHCQWSSCYSVGSLVRRCIGVWVGHKWLRVTGRMFANRAIHSKYHAYWNISTKCQRIGRDDSCFLSEHGSVAFLSCFDSPLPFPMNLNLECGTVIFLGQTCLSMLCALHFL